MAKNIKLGDTVYDLSRLSAEGRRTFKMMTYTDERIAHAQQREAALKRAKNALVSELKAEIVKGKSGVDFDALLGD